MYQSTIDGYLAFLFDYSLNIYYWIKFHIFLYLINRNGGFHYMYREYFCFFKLHIK